MNGYAAPRYALGRICLFTVSMLMTVFFLCASVEKKLPLLTALGRNSLSIYLFHRPFTLLICDKFSSAHTTAILAVAAVGTAIICLVFGSDLVAGWLNAISGALADLFTGAKEKLSPPPARSWLNCWSQPSRWGTYCPSSPMCSTMPRRRTAARIYCTLS